MFSFLQFTRFFIIFEIKSYKNHITENRVAIVQ